MNITDLVRGPHPEARRVGIHFPDRRYVVAAAKKLYLELGIPMRTRTRIHLHHRPPCRSPVVPRTPRTSHRTDRIQRMGQTMKDHTSRCCTRRPPTGELAGSWIRDHVCRLNHGHTGPHQCTCTYEWTPTPVGVSPTTRPQKQAQ